MYLSLGNNEHLLRSSLLGKFLRGLTGFPGGEEKAINPSLSSGAV